MDRILRRAWACVVLTCLWSPGVAAAHINLLSPPPRYSGDSGNKACPCGVGLSNRFCDVEGDRSDADRSAQVTTLVAGSKLVLRFDEYIGHAGRYRIAFDVDGADQADFDAHILVDIPDPAGNTGNSGQGSIWEIEVPVPNAPCDRCTLQLVQMMDGNTDDPVPTPIGRSSYYQCADIVIVDAVEGDAGSDSGAGAESDAGAETADDAGLGAGAGDGGLSGPGASSDAGRGSGLGMAGHVDSGAASSTSTGQGDGGCSLGPAAHGPWLWGCGSLLLWRWSRRQRHACGKRS